MASSHNKSYLLEHVSEVRENPRLNTQHEHITHGIMKGRLVHDSIPIVDLDGPVADICCGTGVWLKDLSDQIAGSRADDKSAAEFFGFDSNPSAFYDGDELPANVHLVKHDCTRPFNPEYHGKFGLVNMRGLTFAIPHETFPALLRNAVSLLSQLKIILL